MESSDHVSIRHEESCDSSSLQRDEGFAPLRDYAVIGDGRTSALVARDGSIDWLTLPDLDSSSVFAAALDVDRGGRFRLEPDVPFESTRRYIDDTNVLETTFRTADGVVRVLDAITLPGGDFGPLRELQRQVEGVSGSVPMRWQVEPRFDYGDSPGTVEFRGAVPIATFGAIAIAVCTFDAGEPTITNDVISGHFEARTGSQATLALCAAHNEPLVFPSRAELEARRAQTVKTWRDWTQQCDYDGPWRDAVIRSVLALKLLVFAPSGAVAAAVTTSLPEEIGGGRNWDYRYSWVRDSAFTIDAFLQLGYPREARAYFWWLMHASQLTRPRIQVLYRLNGAAEAAERELDLAGYRDSRPVRVGNAAVSQLQLDSYGELLESAWLYAQARGALDRDFIARLSDIADFVCDLWRQPDAGIWEVRSDPAHHTQSKMMCWIALDRALSLADLMELPAQRSIRWRDQRDGIREYVEANCWSESKRSYVRVAGGEDLDASLLLGLLFGYGADHSERWEATVEAVQRELAHGPFVQRYSGDDGLSGTEGAFLACSFWLAEALARSGRHAEAVALMDDLVSLANDVGLYSEEMDAQTGAFLGNLPQGLSHLSLIRAARTIADQEPQ